MSRVLGVFAVLCELCAKPVSVRAKNREDSKRTYSDRRKVICKSMVARAVALYDIETFAATRSLTEFEREE